MEINDKSLSQLENGIRQTPLAERLEAAQRMISRMCSKGEPPRMSIPAQSSDEDMFIITTLQDAAGEIERLRAALAEINGFNRIHNDLEAYLFDLAQYALGDTQKKPERSTYGIA